jgi:capsular exopolysaccharide synthesis family protein
MSKKDVKNGSHERPWGYHLIQFAWVVQNNMARSEKQAEHIESGRFESDRFKPDRLGAILHRRWASGAVTFGTVLAATALFSFIQKPIYQAQAQLLLQEASQQPSQVNTQNYLGSLGGAVPNSIPNNHSNHSRPATHPNVARSIPVIQKVIRVLNLRDPNGAPLSSDAFLKQLTITHLPGSALLTLRFDSNDPQQAIAVVEELARENQHQGHLQVVQAAQLVPEPISSKILWNLCLGILLGGLSATAVMLLLDAHDHSIKSVADVKRVLGGEVLSTIPTFQHGPVQSAPEVWSRNPWNSRRWNTSRWNSDQPNPVQSEPVGLALQAEHADSLVVRNHPHSPTSEAYRSLSHRLQALHADAPCQTIAVTSAIPQEGKSTTTANLALALVEQGQRVLLIDADLRLPSQHQIWNLPHRPGLSNIIAEGLHPRRVIHTITRNLDILTAGLIPPNPLDLIDSRRMVTLMGYFSQFYDVILIDTPPVTVAADALVMGKIADGVLMVVRPGLVETTDVLATRNLLTKSQQNLLGVVVTHCTVEMMSITRRPSLSV